MKLLPKTLGAPAPIPENIWERPDYTPMQVYKKFGNGPSQLSIVEMENAEPRTVRPVQRIQAIQPYSIQAASIPKNPYNRVRKETTS